MRGLLGEILSSGLSLRLLLAFHKPFPSQYKLKKKYNAKVDVFIRIQFNFKGNFYAFSILHIFFIVQQTVLFEFSMNAKEIAKTDCI